MGMRFHKSVKLAKGVKLNFSKSGLSTSFGIPGFSYNVGGKGSYLNVGIPGTGISYRTKMSSSAKKPSKSTQQTQSQKSKKTTSTPSQQAVNISIEHYDDGTYAFFLPNGEKITDETIIRKIKSTQAFRDSLSRAKEDRIQMNAEKAEAFNEENENIINTYRHTTILNSELMYSLKLKKLKPETYQIKEFTISPPIESDFEKTLEEEAEVKFTTFLPWKFGEIKKQRAEYVKENLEPRFSEAMKEWETTKLSYEAEQIKLAEQNNEIYMREYEEEKSALQAAIAGDECYIDVAIDNWLGSVELPLDFSVDYEFYPERRILAIDIDLPEIEDIPQQKAKQLANGTLKITDKTQKEVNSDYVECVFGISSFLTSYMANVSPVIEKILVSGYTQRRNNKTGELQDDYVYSIIFDRNTFNENKSKASTGKEFCFLFKNRCNILANGNMKIIVPYEIDDIT